MRTVDPEAPAHLRHDERARLHHEALFAALYYRGLIPLDGGWWPRMPPAPEHMSPLREVEIPPAVADVPKPVTPEPEPEASPGPETEAPSEPKPVAKPAEPPRLTRAKPLPAPGKADGFVTSPAWKRWQNWL